MDRQVGCSEKKEYANEDKSFEFTAGPGLFEADAAGGDVGLEIVFAQDGRAGEAAEHGDLPDMSKGVGNGALEEALGWGMKWFAGGKKVIEFLEGSEETIEFVVPRQGNGVMPGLSALGDRKRPIKEITHVSKNLRRRARLVADVEAVEMIGSIAKGFAAAIGDSGDGMA